MSWLPVDQAAQSLLDIAFFHSPLPSSSSSVPSVLHLENPIRQPISDALTIMAREVLLPPSPPSHAPKSCPGTEMMIPFEEWMQRAREKQLLGSLDDFFAEHFRDLAAHGAVMLDTSRCRQISRTLRGAGGVSADLLRGYVQRWRGRGFLD